MLIYVMTNIQERDEMQDLPTKHLLALITLHLSLKRQVTCKIAPINTNPTNNI